MTVPKRAENMSSYLGSIILLGTMEHLINK